jgi:quercetin dioxygenase-like cupin family protein
MKHLKIVVPVSGVVLTALATAIAASAQGAIKTEILLKQSSSWNRVPYHSYPSGTPELVIRKMLIPAHSALPWHTHSVPNAAYIVSGHLVVEDRASGQTASYRAGQAFAESVGPVHRGRTENEPALVIVTYSAVPGTELSTPVKDQAQPR